MNYTIILYSCILLLLCGGCASERSSQNLTDDRWPVLGWSTNEPSLRPVTNSVPR